MIEKVLDIKSILNLRSNDSIAEELANRQLEAITKSYLYLSKPSNNIIYIADEVGLGKTYIAAGIAMLFRHFSADANSHKDLIIVPKKNLQEKWKKELKNFVSNNYLCEEDLIKQQYHFDEAIKDRLMPVRHTDPISIFRMTSFSSIAATQNRKAELYEYLLSYIFNNDEFARTVLDDAWSLGFFKKGFESSLRKLVAYLMNALSPKINCLIIDEAHNYKKGVGVEDDESIRNETTARFLGAVKDNHLLSQFPQLKLKVKFPLAEKIICLSATPKDRSLLEIKNQFNCFTNNHILSNAKTPAEIEERLKCFLLRGNLEYVLDSEVVSRNQCRVEHRKGNVNKSESAIPLTIEDSFDAVFWQLLQYKSIKHLDQKNNASFEIGMLASFETYMADLDRRNSKNIEASNKPEAKDNDDKEYEQTAHRSIQESQDINIIRGIMASYYEKFKKFPPHPKQTKLEDEVIAQLKRQEKSLIFVRRVASSYELEKRIKERFENEIVLGQYLKFTGKFTKFKTPELNSLINNFNNYYSEMIVSERLNDTLRLLLDKSEIKNALFSYAEIDDSNYQAEGLIWLRIAFDSDQASAFKAYIIDYIKKRTLKNISQALKDVTISAINQTYNEYKRHSEKDEEIDGKSEDTQSGYFFLDYFKKGRKGFYYRQKMYRENWFEINPVILNNHFKYIEYPVQGLNAVLSNVKFDTKKKKNQSFKLATETALEYFQQKGCLNTSSESINLNIPAPLKETTFITRLLCEYCDIEMRNWLQKRLKAGNHILYLRDLKLLNALLRNILRNGSGLLPGFIADSTGLNFDDELLYLITASESPFAFVLQEIKTIINDFDLIVAVNFQERDENKINAILRNLTPIVGTSGQDDRDRGILAAQFRMPGFPYVLITTDIFREGEDLHTYCQNVYHYGIAWNPSDMEQRTGRIDRINSKSYRMLNSTKELSFQNKVQVFYPYLQQSVEVNQVVQLLKNLNRFVETFNDIVTDIKYESAVSINEEIIDENIPAPITKRLKSKYDVHEFEV